MYDASNTAKGFKTVSNGSSYTYDSNGNLTSDPNKNITGITYNHMNLPITISFSGGNSITFMYDAGGNKLRKTVSGSINYVQDYVGGIEYRSSVLEAIYHAEGRVTNVNGALKYEYAIKDHLGNTRIMFCDKNGNGRVESTTAQETSEITQENHYYPFGLNMEGTWCNTPSITDTKYQYNGKELNDDFGLGWMNYGSRNYDATIAKFTSYDAMSEVNKHLSPYNYCDGNPVAYIDVNGYFKLDPETAKLFPNLVTFLTALPQIYKDKPEAFKSAFRKYSKLTDIEIMKLLTYGDGPTLILDDLKLIRNGVNGKTSSGETIIVLDYRIPYFYELARPKGKLENIKDKIYGVLESTIFHELTHFGDEMKGGSDAIDHKNNLERGEAFEIEAYGRDQGMQRDIKPFLPADLQDFLSKPADPNLDSTKKKNNGNDNDKPLPPLKKDKV